MRARSLRPTRVGACLVALHAGHALHVAYRSETLERCLGSSTDFRVLRTPPGKVPKATLRALPFLDDPQVARGLLWSVASTAMQDPGFSVEVRETEGPAGIVFFRGRLDFARAPVLWDETTKLLLTRAPAPASRLDFDLSGVTAVDGGAMALLVHLRNRLAGQGVHSEFVGAGEQVQEIVHLYEGDLHLPPRTKRKAESVLSQIGRGTVAVLLEGKLVSAVDTVADAATSELRAELTSAAKTAR